MLVLPWPFFISGDMKIKKKTRDDIEIPKIPKGWCEEEFSGANFNDKRLTSRLCNLSESLAALPKAPINQACKDWDATKAGYRFFKNPKVTPEKIIQPHIENTKKRVQSHERVLAVQDTCLPCYDHHPSKKNMGHVGKNKEHTTSGMLIHTTLAVTPQGLPLGILAQEIWSRDPENENESEKAKRKGKEKI